VPLHTPRTASVRVAGSGLVAASLGDFAQGYDGPGPFVFLAAGLLVLLVPWRLTPLPAVVTSVFFLAGALANSSDLAAAVDGGGLLACTGVVVQLAGFAVSAVAGCLALRGVRRERGPHASTGHREEG